VTARDRPYTAHAHVCYLADDSQFLSLKNNKHFFLLSAA